MTKRYIIMELEDVKRLSHAARSTYIADDKLAKILKRVNSEKGADIEAIVSSLKTLNLCHACVIEGQERSCAVPYAQQIGRRLRRLVDRANYITPNVEE